MGADPFVGASGVYYHAAQLWTSARDLAQQFERAEVELVSSRTPAGLSVILFAAFSVETFLNELTYLASQHSAKDPQAAALHAALMAAEEGHGPIRLKLQLAVLTLASKPIDKGGPPYQDFDLLFKIRDEIAHGKAHRLSFTASGIETEPKKLLARLYQQKLISDPTSRPAESFLSRITTAPLCRWAVSAAQEMIRYVVGLISPQGDFGKRTRFLLAQVLK